MTESNENMNSSEKPIVSKASSKKGASKKSAKKVASKRVAKPAKSSTAKKTSGKKTPKLGRHEWIEAAFRTLVESGVASIHVETLAKRLGVTKGSFYWHFKDRTELLESVLEKWQEQFVIARVETMGGGSDDRLLNLLNIVPRQRGSYQRGGSMELAMRSWARTDDEAMEAVEKVDRTRVNFVESLLEPRGHSGVEKEARAFLIYSYLMCQGIFSFDKEDDILERIHKDVLNILLQPPIKDD
ncbi:MAG: TetR/AcrR family transcriptional regulator [Alphaproteobacteria bacterium]|nr:TetR/AcrR family transcriptional regulator [Alphaproteobacteria bacterium]